MKNPSKGDIVRAIRKHREAIAKHRDALRRLHSDLTDILESTDEGVQELDIALDKLSEYL
jgi:hypothetical protein